MSFRKSSNSKNGSKSDVFPKPKARRKCTPAPSRVGLDFASRFTGRMDMLVSKAKGKGQRAKGKEQRARGKGERVKGKGKSGLLLRVFVESVYLSSSPFTLCSLALPL